MYDTIDPSPGDFWGLLNPAAKPSLPSASSCRSGPDATRPVQRGPAADEQPFPEWIQMWLRSKGNNVIRVKSLKWSYSPCLATKCSLNTTEVFGVVVDGRQKAAWHSLNPEEIYMKYITELKVKRRKIYTIGKDIQQLNH